jgi:tRNA(His) 5'-end guanylyltransferase
MKGYEADATRHTFDLCCPVYARIDGRAFHTFTRDMARPFDDRLTKAMIDTTKVLVEKTHAAMGYTQSDEISLCWVKGAQVLFPKKHKMTSVLASLAAAAFMNSIRNHWHMHEDPYAVMDRLPHFDCRIFNMPSKTEVANMFLWRAMDARKNAISMAAQAVFSHKKLQGAGQATMIEMLRQEGIDFDGNYPDRHKHGVWVRRENKIVVLSEDLRLKIPEKNRPSAGAKVMRSETKEIQMPVFNKVLNREGVIFEGQPALTEDCIVDD